MAVVGVVALLGLSLFGVKSLLIFSSRNGAFGYFEAAVAAGCTPSGQPLRPLTTHGRFPKVDQQIKAVCVFFLLYCENWQVPETSLAGLSFVGAWGASWALIMLDSFRAYSQHHLLAWISIPGIVIFNYSHAIFTPIYLAFRLAFTPAPTSGGVVADETLLRTFPTAFLVAYCLPLLLLSLPSLTVRGINTKHTLAGLWQQWNVYISLCQFFLIKFAHYSSAGHGGESLEDRLDSLEKIYRFILIIAGVTFWVPTLIAATEWTRALVCGGRTQRKIRPWDVMFPPSPFADRKAHSASEGGRWLIQWDTITGTTATIVWALALRLEAHGSADRAASLWVTAESVLWSGLRWGPMGIPVTLLWQRDKMILTSNPP